MADFGTLLDANTLRMERLLPGPIEKVWAFLTDSDKRAKWLAGGNMATKAGGSHELVWRNNDLTPYEDDVEPESLDTGCADGEFKMQGHILAYEPYNRLAFTWEEGSPDESEVTFELQEVDDKVRLTLTHKRLVGSDRILSVSAGWHAHIDILVDILGEKIPAPFWSNMMQLRDTYSERHQLS